MTTPALALATQLRAELARRNIPSLLHELPDGWVALSLWRGLVARTDGHIIWWTTPYMSRRNHPLATYAFHPQHAALRLSRHYPKARELHPVPLGRFAEISAPI